MRQNPVKHAFLVGLAVVVGLVVLQFAAKAFPQLEAAMGSLVPLIFFWLPLGMILSKRLEFSRFGLTGQDKTRNLGVGLSAAFIVLPLFVLGYWLYWEVLVGREIHWHFGWILLWQLPIQLLAVAVPEEVFFRGYLQTLFSEGWGINQSGFWRKHVPAIVVSSAIFALAHMATTPALFRLGVFFPGLLFGFLRARTGSLIPSIVLHTLANVTIFILEGKV